MSLTRLPAAASTLEVKYYKIKYRVGKNLLQQRLCGTCCECQTMSDLYRCLYFAPVPSLSLSLSLLPSLPLGTGCKLAGSPSKESRR